jgi:hypothetical protein
VTYSAFLPFHSIPSRPNLNISFYLLVINLLNCLLYHSFLPSLLYKFICLLAYLLTDLLVLSLIYYVTLL